MDRRRTSQRSLSMQQAPKHRANRRIECCNPRKPKRCATAPEIDVKTPCPAQYFALVRRGRQRRAQAQDQLIMTILVLGNAGERCASGRVIIDRSSKATKGNCCRFFATAKDREQRGQPFLVTHGEGRIDLERPDGWRP